MLKKVYYKDFKSFKETELSVEIITTLIGTNAAGKTNAIEGIMVLSEIMSGRDFAVILDGTKNNRAQIRSGAQGCCRSGENSFSLGCTVQYDDNIDLIYRITITVGDRIMVAHESLHELSNHKGGSTKMLFETKQAENSSGDIAVSCNNGQKGRNPDIMCIRFASAISQIPTKLPQDRQYGKTIVEYSNKVLSTLKSILFLNPDTNSMRGYATINDKELNVNASNISAVLYDLCGRNGNKDKLTRIMQELPENEVVDISFIEGPLSDVILALVERVGQKEERVDAKILSDGTLRCLAIATAVLSENSGGMVVVEEMDNGIHPGRAKALISLVSEIAKERNVDVLFTTHNAMLLNSLSREDLSGVQIVYRDNLLGDARFVSLIDLDNVAGLLANGKLGDVFATDKILQYIKKDAAKKPDYSWLGVLS